MASVAVDQLGPLEVQELLCVYSSLLLHDDGLEITKENISKIIKTAGGHVEPYLPMLFAKALNGKDLNSLFGSASASAAVAAPGSSAPAAAGEAAKEDTPKSEAPAEEEEDDDMGFSLFD